MLTCALIYLLAQCARPCGNVSPANFAAHPVWFRLSL